MNARRRAAPAVRDQPCYVSDIGKAQARLGWSPAVGKEEGIRRLADWVRANMDLFRPRARQPAPAPARRPQPAQSEPAITAG